MLTREDFMQQYATHTDEELYNMYLQKEDYSEEGQSALLDVIGHKGGLGRLEQLVQQRQIIDRETSRIEKDTRKLAIPGTDDEFLVKMITSDILSEEQVKRIVLSKLAEIKLEHKDQSITPRTIWGSIAGGSIAVIIGGIIWGLQLIQMQRMFWILAFGLYLLSYGLIKWFTRQTKNNTVVLFAAILATALAISLGQILYVISAGG